MSGTRSVCLSLWKVDDTATALLMQGFQTPRFSVTRGSSQRRAGAAVYRWVLDIAGSFDTVVHCWLCGQCSR